MQKNGYEIALCTFEQVLGQKSVLYQNQDFFKSKVDWDRINFQ